VTVPAFIGRGGTLAGMGQSAEGASAGAVGPRSTADALDAFGRHQLPLWAPVRRTLDAREIDDVAGAVAEAVAPVRNRITPGQRVALALGSRGIDRIALVAKAVVEQVKARGALPFVVPAMGSHGGATARGQVEVLAALGITEEALGCPVRAGMETVELGVTRGGLRVHFDRIAFQEADAVLPINRVKLHTDFTGPVESGLLKMVAIGLGKQRGADAIHAAGFDRFGELIPQVAVQTLSRVNVPFGLALLENGVSRLRRIEAVPGEAMAAREPFLHDESASYLARLPTDTLDVLVVDRLGKDISGLGMDPNVIGRYYTGPRPSGPRVQRIVVRGLTEATDGNANGIGLADIVLRGVLAQMDPVATAVNCITAKTPEGARVGIAVATDRQALAIALACCIRVEPEAARLMRIADTKHLERFWASASMLAELESRADCEILGPARPIAFDDEGMLADVVA
jgi:hypothetical protein